MNNMNNNKCKPGDNLRGGPTTNQTNSFLSGVNLKQTKDSAKTTSSCPQKLKMLQSVAGKLLLNSLFFPFPPL